MDTLGPVADRRRRPTTPRIPKRWQEDPDISGAVERCLDPVIDRLYAHRESRGWSQDMAAGVAGIRPQTLRDIENRRCVPDLPTIVRLFFIYGEEPAIVPRLGVAVARRRSTVRNSQDSTVQP